MTVMLRVRAALVLVLSAVAGLTGCVQVPTAGPLEKVPGQSEVCQNCINVEVAPPAPGAQPLDVVRGYLLAMSNYQPNYATARQFLTAAAAEAWQPEVGVSIYDGSPKVRGNSVELDGRLIGVVGMDRTYTAQDARLRWNFDLVQQDGEWRISRPPPGLLVAEYPFSRFYTGYSTYFIGNGASLVPERIYLPALRNPANIASALMTALLDGPSKWLDPAVETSFPMGTSLSVASVPTTAGIAEVPLNDAVLDLPDLQRSLMAAQIVYTLRQVPAVKGVLITVGRQKFQVPGADPTSSVIAVDALSREIDPVPPVSDQLFAVQNDRVSMVTTPSEMPALRELNSPVGQGRFGVDSLAVSVDGTDLAVVTDGQKVLRRASTTTSDVTTLEKGLTALLRPQFSRYGEIWAIGEQGGKQRFWLSSPDLPNTVAAPVLNRGTITAFRISPDGVRMALVRRSAAGRDELGLATIVRGGEVTVDGWKTIDVTQPGSSQLARIFDVGWLDANEMLVLGASSPEAAPVTVRVAADASRVVTEGGDPTEWNARELTALSRPQTVVVVGLGGKTWRKSGGRWLPFLSDVTTVAYAG